MEVLTEYKGLTEGHLVIDQGSFAIIRYFMKEETALIEHRDDGKEYCFARITLIGKYGKPRADTTVSVDRLQILSDYNHFIR